MDETNKLSGGDISLTEIIESITGFLKFLISKWVVILAFGFGGALIGLVASFMIKPKYTANLSFSLVEKGNTTSGLASLASTFGFGGLLGGGGDAFTGDNLLEIIKSRYAIEKTLLTSINFEGEQMTMVDAYLRFMQMSNQWKKSKNIELRTISYPVHQNRETFSRTQDSVLYVVYDNIFNKEGLNVIRKNKKINIVNVSLTSKNEVFSKLFVENLMSQTYEFYKVTRTAQSRSNINMMQHAADSIKNLYENALYNSAGISQVNINSALQLAVVPRLQEEYNAQLYGTVYAEVLKNLETLRLDLARETPIIQIIDTPIYPLKKTKLGKIKGVVYGGFLGGISILLLLGVMFYLNLNMKTTVK
ncbi:MAG: hypothetical protein Q7J05_01865 [Paludibacter sp.]|nr:hypothetical protein [Paludibacter sp.]